MLELGVEVNLGFFLVKGWLRFGLGLESASGLVLGLLLGFGLGLNWGCDIFLTCSAQPPHPLQVHIIRQFHVLGVDLQDLQPASRVGDPNVNLPVKPSCR